MDYVTNQRIHIILLHYCTKLLTIGTAWIDFLKES